MNRENIYSRKYHMTRRKCKEEGVPDLLAVQLARAAGNEAVQAQEMGKHKQGSIVEIDFYLSVCIYIYIYTHVSSSRFLLIAVLEET